MSEANQGNPKASAPGTRVKFDASYIGCVIDGSADSADYINEQTIDFAESYGFEFEPLPKNDDTDDCAYSEALNEEAENAIAFLNDQDNLPYCFWYFDDNSLFYSPYIDNVKEDVDFVSSRENEYPPDDYVGEWLHVSDHGNATLYVRKNGEDREIWGIV